MRLTANEVRFNRLQEFKSPRLRSKHSHANLSGSIMVDAIFAGKLVTSILLEAIELLGPFVVDKSKRIWHCTQGVWNPNELDIRVVFYMGDKYKADHV